MQTSTEEPITLTESFLISDCIQFNCKTSNDEACALLVDVSKKEPQEFVWFANIPVPERYQASQFTLFSRQEYFYFGTNYLTCSLQINNQLYDRDRPNPAIVQPLVRLVVNLRHVEQPNNVELDFVMTEKCFERLVFVSDPMPSIYTLPIFRNNIESAACLKIDSFVLGSEGACGADLEILALQDKEMKPLEVFEFYLYVTDEVADQPDIFFLRSSMLRRGLQLEVFPVHPRCAKFRICNLSLSHTTTLSAKCIQIRFSNLFGACADRENILSRLGFDESSNAFIPYFIKDKKRSLKY